MQDDFVRCECDATRLVCQMAQQDGAAVYVTPLHRYEADLGMRTRGALRRQLEVDVPRCVATVDGARVRRGDDPAWRRVRHARMCTQAALAPPVEWLLRAGVLAHESGTPMRVAARGAHEVEVCKELRVRATAPHGGKEGTVWLRVHADGTRDVASVEMRLLWHRKDGAALGGVFLEPHVATQ